MGRRRAGCNPAKRLLSLFRSIRGMSFFCKYHVAGPFTGEDRYPVGGWHQRRTGRTVFMGMGGQDYETGQIRFTGTLSIPMPFRCACNSISDE